MNICLLVDDRDRWKRDVKVEENIEGEDEAGISFVGNFGTWSAARIE